MESLRSRIKRKQAGEIPSSRPTRTTPTKKEISVRKMLEEGSKEFLKNLNMTAAAFPGGGGSGGGGVVGGTASGGTVMSDLVPDDANFATINKGTLNTYIKNAAAAGGGLLMIPQGYFYITGLVNPLYSLRGIVIQGQGPATQLQQVGSASSQPLFARRNASDDPNYALGGRFVFRFFEVHGTWQSAHSQRALERLFNVNGLDYVEYDSIYCFDSREMSITSNFCREAVVRNCRIQRSARDAINLTNCSNTHVVGNTIIDCWDDSVAVHTDPATDLPSQGHVCYGNVIENGHGISYDGANKVTIGNNTMRRVHAYGVFVKGFSTAGLNDATDIDIHNNIITDVMVDTKFVGGSNVVFEGILVASSGNNSYVNPITGGPAPLFRQPNLINFKSNKSQSIVATSNGTAVLTGIADTTGMIVGQGVRGTGIVSGTTIKSIDSATQITLSLATTDSSTSARTFSGNAGLNAIRVNNNVIRQTLPPLSKYSLWGFTNQDGGVGAWTDSGYQDPSFTSNFNRAGAGIRLDQTILDCEVNGNTVEGYADGIGVVNTLAHLYNLHVTGNKFKRMSNAGVNLNSGASLDGRAYIHNNEFDLDPYFEHTNRAGPITKTGDTATSTIVSNIAPATTDLFSGMRVSGSGVQEGTIIASVDTATQVTLSLATTSTLVTTSLVFGDKDGRWTEADGTPKGIDSTNWLGPISDIGNTYRNLNRTFFPDTTTATVHRAATYVWDPIGVTIGSSFFSKGIGMVSQHHITDSNIIEISDPMSVDYGKLDTPQVGGGLAIYGLGISANRWYTQSDAGPIVTQRAVTADSLIFVPFLVPEFRGFDQMALRVSVGEAGTKCRLGVYSSANGIPSASWMYDFGEILLDSSGLVSTTQLARRIVLEAGYYWLACLFNTNTTLRINGSMIDQRWRQQMLGGATDNVSTGYNLHTTFTWDPGSIAALGLEDHTGITLSGAAVGDRAFVYPPYDTQGLIFQARVTATDTCAVTAFNPTVGAIDLASSAAWVIGVDKKDTGDFFLTASQAYGALPTTIPTIIRSSTVHSPRLMIRRIS